MNCFAAPKVCQAIGVFEQFQNVPSPGRLARVVNPVEKAEHNAIIQFQFPDARNICTGKEIERYGMLMVAPDIQQWLVTVKLDPLFR